MMINAWELFLKAEMLKDKGYDSIIKKNGKSITISTAIEDRFSSKDPIYDSIKSLVDLRDQAVHLLIPELQPKLARLFQSNVLNYQDRYTEIIGKSPLEGQSVGMLSLIIDGSDTEIGVIKENYGDRTATEVQKFLGKFDVLDKKHNSDQFSVSIEYKLSLSRNPKNADLTLTTGDNGKPALVLTKTKTEKYADTYKYLTAEVKDKINSLQSVKITNHDLYSVVSKHKVKGNPTMHSFMDVNRYTEHFANWFVDKMNQPNWLQSARDHYRVHNAKSKAKKGLTAKQLS